MKKLALFSILPALLLLWWAAATQTSAPTVHFAAVSKQTIESTVPTNGKVEPVQWAAARAETAGVVQTVNVRRGQQVEAGDVLVALDPAAARAEWSAAVARVEEAKAEGAVLAQGGRSSQLAEIDNLLKSARLTVAEAQRNYDALERLSAKQAATSQETAAAKNTLESARIQQNALEDRRRTLVGASDRSVAQARLTGAQAAVDLARHRIELSVIKSPLSGTVYQFDLKKGAYLNPGDLVALVGKLDQVKVTIFVDEPELGRVTEEIPVNITWEAHPDQKWTGKVLQLPTEVVALGSRTVGEVTSIVDNPNHDLLPGVTVNATIVSKVAKDVVSIPKQALRSDRKGSGVLKLAGDTVVWQPVEKGVSDINSVEIRAGLQPGDRVALPAEAELKNGSKVKPILD